MTSNFEDDKKTSQLMTTYQDASILQADIGKLCDYSGKRQMKLNFERRGILNVGEYLRVYLSYAGDSVVNTSWKKIM